MNKTTFQTSSLQKKAIRYREYILLILLVCFSTAFSFAVGVDQRNYLLIGVMGFASIIFPFTFSLFHSTELYIYGFYFSLFLCLAIHPESFRVSTLIYTLMFLLTFVFYIRNLYKHFLSFRGYIKILKIILYAYFFVLVIQQFCLIVNLPIFNFIAGDGLEFKLNSLSPEPSHSARIIILLFYSFICMRELAMHRSYSLYKDGVSDLFIWFCFLYAMLTMGSGTAFLLLALFFARFVSIPTIFLGAGLFTLAFLVSHFFIYDLIPLNRVLTFFSALLTGSPGQIVVADHSASIRVLPVYYYFQQLNILSFEFWFGFGIDYSIEMFPKYIPGISTDNKVGGLGSTLLLNHGIFAGILMMVMACKYCFDKFWGFSTLLFVVIIFACGINTQITWLAFILFATNKYFDSKQKMCRRL